MRVYRAARSLLDGRSEEQKLQIVKRAMKQANNTSQAGKLDKLINYLKSIKEEELTGYIKVNFNQGNICKIEKFEEILRK